MGCDILDIRARRRLTGLCRLCWRLPFGSSLAWYCAAMARGCWLSWWPVGWVPGSCYSSEDIVTGRSRRSGDTPFFYQIGTSAFGEKHTLRGVLSIANGSMFL